MQVTMYRGTEFTSTASQLYLPPTCIVSVPQLKSLSAKDKVSWSTQLIFASRLPIGGKTIILQCTMNLQKQDFSCDQSGQTPHVPP